MAGEDADRETIARLTSEVMPALIERLAGSELGELEVREQGWRIRLRRPLAGNGAAPLSSRQGTKPVPVMSHSGNDAHPPRREPERGLITSPAVGYYLPRDGVSVGSAVTSGDLVGHVEVLGVRQEVVARMDGTLASVEVETGQAVEYGQPIARVAPGRVAVDV